jgi:hypothetical protein
MTTNPTTHDSPEFAAFRAGWLAALDGNDDKGSMADVVLAYEAWQATA